MAKKKSLKELIDEKMFELLAQSTMVPAVDMTDDAEVVQVAQHLGATDSTQLWDRIGEWIYEGTEFDGIAFRSSLKEFEGLASEANERIQKVIPFQMKKSTGVEIAFVHVAVREKRDGDIDVVVDFSLESVPYEMTAEKRLHLQETIMDNMAVMFEPDEVEEWGYLSQFRLIYKFGDDLSAKHMEREIDFFRKEAQKVISKRERKIDKLLAA